MPTSMHTSCIAAQMHNWMTSMPCSAAGEWRAADTTESQIRFPTARGSQQLVNISEFHLGVLLRFSMGFSMGLLIITLGFCNLTVIETKMSETRKPGLFWYSILVLPVAKSLDFGVLEFDAQLCMFDLRNIFQATGQNPGQKLASRFHCTAKTQVRLQPQILASKAKGIGHWRCSDERLILVTPVDLQSHLPTWFRSMSICFRMLLQLSTASHHTRALGVSYCMTCCHLLSQTGTCDNRTFLLASFYTPGRHWPCADVPGHQCLLSFFESWMLVAVYCSKLRLYDVLFFPRWWLHVIACITTD